MALIAEHPMKLQNLLLSGLALSFAACATNPDQVANTGATREKTENCRYERSLGSNIKKARCGPARDDRDRLKTMGSVDSIAGHARTSGGN